MKRYEGLFILDIAGKEEGIKETIDKLSDEITAAGAKIETVQKMEKKNFTRIADKKYTAGFYVNVIFEAQPSSIEQLKHKFTNHPDVFRVMFTDAAAPKAPAIATA